MNYLEQLKRENMHQGALPKLTKPPFDSFDSMPGKGFLEKTASILPEKCPISTGGPVPSECRFAPRLFRRLITEQVLPNPDDGCPLRDVCGLDPRRRTQKPIATRCLGFDCGHVGYRQHDGIECLWCDHAKQPVIDLLACPMDKWTRDDRGWPQIKKGKECPSH